MSAWVTHITTYTEVWLSYFIDLYRYHPILNTSSLQCQFWYIDIWKRFTWIIKITTYITMWNVYEVLTNWDADQYNLMLFFCFISDQYLISISAQDTPNENYALPRWEKMIWLSYSSTKGSHTTEPQPQGDKDEKQNQYWTLVWSQVKVDAKNLVLVLGALMTWAPALATQHFCRHLF